MTQCRLFSPDEYKAQEEARRSAVSNFMADHLMIDGVWPPELQALSDSFFPPGSMWFCPWYHDPTDNEDLRRVGKQIAALESGRERGWMSIHYLKSWAAIRPPIMVICPGGGHWCVDQGSANGSGWVITGTAPIITASPSIWVSQGKGAPREYHGWLRDGVFSPA